MEISKLLLVEDTPEIGEGLQDYFGCRGYEVKHLDRGERAVQAIRTTSPDVVLLDVRLPGKDGFQILQEARASGLDVPIVVMTVLTETKHRAKAFDLGADGYVAKPFALEDLSRALQAALDK